MSKKINIAVIGATGYTGLDLIYMLTKHPKANIEYLCATKKLGKYISYFDKRIKKKLPKISSVNNVNWKNIDVAFLSIPNGKSQELIKNIYNKFKKVKFIDLSADFRIVNSNEYYKNYKIKHKAKDFIKKSIYSISEFVKKDIKKFRIIANPGCYPTSIQIPLVPIINKKLINNNIIIDSKSGYSGAGKNFEKKFNHKNLYNSIFAYSPMNHRHTVEINQELKRKTKKKINFIFNPHLIPTFRGILSTIYVELGKNSSAHKIRNELIRFYKKNNFVKILKLNSQLGTGNVLNTNNCEISICDSELSNKIIIFSAIDNLVKGASGQAIQNMNLIYKYPETLGLK
jgi:N-acetyl-gamma-glutamyl-phosphate reductase